MKYKVFASFVGIDWAGNTRSDPSSNFQFGWTDHEIIVHSNSKKNARKKVWKWAKSRGAKQKQIAFVNDEIWRTDKLYKTRILK